MDNVWVHFSGSTVDGAGRLTPTSGSDNLRFELIDGSGGTAIVAGGVAGTAGPVLATHCLCGSEHGLRI